MWYSPLWGPPGFSHCGGMDFPPKQGACWQLAQDSRGAPPPCPASVARGCFGQAPLGEGGTREEARASSGPGMRLDLAPTDRRDKEASRLWSGPLKEASPPPPAHLIEALIRPPSSRQLAALSAGS